MTSAISQATLRTARLRLEPLSDEHLRHEIELDADPEVMRHLGPARTAEEVTGVHRHRLAQALHVPGLGYWAGFEDGAGSGVGADSSDSGGGGFVGWWILGPPERPDQGPVEGQAELGYRLLRRHWRRGLASEGARELLRHAFEDLGLTRVFGETMAVNAGSRATMAAVGMHYVRTLHLHFDDPLPGAELGEVEYAVTREQWRASLGD